MFCLFIFSERRRKAQEAQRQNKCPEDMTVFTDRGESFATVLWNPVGVLAESGQPGQQSNENDYDAVFDDEGLSPGSQFSLGRTNVVYTIRRKSDNSVVANCDFIINVKDSEPPRIDCPGDIYVMTSFNTNEGKVRWTVPDVSDNSGEPYEGDLKLEQTEGPQNGEVKAIGSYQVRYKATDYFGNQAFCVFNVIVADRQAPKIIGCPKDSEIAVYEDNEFSAYPEWDAPRATDNIDGNVNVEQLTGPTSGSKLSIPPGKQEASFVIMYEATDSSDNGARCQFTITLKKGDENSMDDVVNNALDDASDFIGKQHRLFRDRLSTRMPIGQDNAEIESKTGEGGGYDLEGKEEDKQPEKWTEKARRLQDERKRKRDAKRERKERRRNRRRGGHRSKVHEDNVNQEDEEDVIDKLRDEIETNDELNEIVDDANDGNKNRKESRAERRRRRKRERKKNKGKTWESIKNFFWSLIRPWTWPIWLIIPLLLLCTSGMFLSTLLSLLFVFLIFMIMYGIYVCNIYRMLCWSLLFVRGYKQTKRCTSAKKKCFFMV